MVSCFRLGCICLFSGIYFLDQKKPFLPGFLRIHFFPVFSGGIFHRNVVLEVVTGIPVFCRCHMIFFAGIPAGQEFLYLPRIPPDSSGFRWIPDPAKRFLALASD
jgi:hypothetical protein